MNNKIKTGKKQLNILFKMKICCFRKSLWC